jgi:predicted DNA-binding protein (MmcQ/YjbR family)
MAEQDRQRSADELAMIAKMKEITAGLPEVDVIIDGFGHTTFKVAKKSFVLIGGGHADEGSLSVKTDPDTQEALIKRGPWVRTPYIGQHGWVSLFGSGTSDWEEIEELTREAYNRVAPKRLKKPGAGI